MTNHAIANRLFIIQTALFAIKDYSTSDKIDRLCVAGITQTAGLIDQLNVHAEVKEIKERQIDPMA